MRSIAQAAADQHQALAGDVEHAGPTGDQQRRISAAPLTSAHRSHEHKAGFKCSGVSASDTIRLLP
jgi:hypothetical protein